MRARSFAGACHPQAEVARALLAPGTPALHPHAMASRRSSRTPALSHGELSPPVVAYSRTWIHLVSCAFMVAIKRLWHNKRTVPSVYLAIEAMAASVSPLMTGATWAGNSMPRQHRPPPTTKARRFLVRHMPASPFACSTLHCRHGRHRQFLHLRCRRGCARSCPAAQATWRAQSVATPSTTFPSPTCARAVMWWHGARQITHPAHPVILQTETTQPSIRLTSNLPPSKIMAKSTAGV